MTGSTQCFIGVQSMVPSRRSRQEDSADIMIMPSDMVPTVNSIAAVLSKPKRMMTACSSGMAISPPPAPSTPAMKLLENPAATSATTTGALSVLRERASGSDIIKMMRLTYGSFINYSGNANYYLAAAVLRCISSSMKKPW